MISTVMFVRLLQSSVCFQFSFSSSLFDSWFFVFLSRLRFFIFPLPLLSAIHSLIHLFFFFLLVYYSFLFDIFLRLFQNLSASLDSSYKKGSTSTLTCDVTGRKLSGHILLRIIRFSLLHTQVHDKNFRCACAPLRNAHTDTKHYFVFRYSKVNARIYEQLFSNQTIYYHSCIFFE